MRVRSVRREVGTKGYLDAEFCWSIKPAAECAEHGISLSGSAFAGEDYRWLRSARPVGQVAGGVPDRVDDDIGRRRFVEDEIRAGLYRQPPQPSKTCRLSVVWELREDLLDVPQPLPHAPGSLRRLRFEMIQNRDDIGCRRAGVVNLQASYLAQMACISSSLAISPRRAASRERCTATSCSGVRSVSGRSSSPR